MSTLRKLFGTDGIRGEAGKPPLDAVTVYALGRALGEWAAVHSAHPEVVIGMDTRESGPELAAEVAGGLRDAGVGSRFAGLITTPGVAWLTRSRDFVAGVMISASHNPYQDNGIKVFDHSGFKLPDNEEHQLEARIFQLIAEGVRPKPATLTVDEGLDEAYIDYLVHRTDTRFDRMKLVVDCANGAASHLATDLFRRLGADVHTIGCSPDGRNINLNCGALHVDHLRTEVLRLNADAGIAFDGDADRCIMVAASGRIVDGDAALLIIARSLKQAGKLRQPMVIATVMSNIGLEQALKAEGLGMLRTAVGDKYVLEEMIRRDAQVGGEQSGHVILRDWATTGDGMLTALVVLDAAARSGKTLDELASALRVFPQTLVNVKFRERKPLDQLPGVQEQIRSAEAAFGDQGRVVVRFSGTEPLARVMVEGPDEASVHHWADRIASAIREEIGA